MIVREADAVVHCAASIEFTLSHGRATAINVDGTRRILDLAAYCVALNRFVHVSTAFVAGHRAGRYLEREFDVGQAVRNTYERTKLDVVPVDGVADALLELLHNTDGGAVHIVAGDEAPSIQDLADLVSAAFDVPPPRFTAPGQSPEAERRAGRFLSYLKVCGTFDGGRRHAGGHSPPRFEAWEWAAGLDAAAAA